MNKRIILVTGANGALGLAICESFLLDSPDTHVCMGVHHRREQADALANNRSGRCSVLQLDVTSRDSWAGAVESVLDKHGRIDVLVNNAGTHHDSLLAHMTPEAWRSVLSVNLDGVFLGSQAVLSSMIHQKQGRIINVSSLSAISAPAGQTNYAAAKAGVIAFTQSLAKEVARIGITVNVVCPGYLETEMLQGLDQARMKQALAVIPMRRFGKPQEVAEAIRFLACPAASYITGSTLKIDGGIL